MALTGLLPRRPDLVLSGINNGANMGDDTLYSGTVAAAMEGLSVRHPGDRLLAGRQGLGRARRRGAHRARGRRGGARPAACPSGPWLLNVNIPNRADADALPRHVTRLGRRHASEPVIRQTSPRGDAIYWIGPAGDARDAGEGTDFHATANGQVSITPLQVDLTDHAAAASAWARPPGTGAARDAASRSAPRFPVALRPAGGAAGAEVAAAAPTAGAAAAAAARGRARRRTARRAARAWGWTRRRCARAWCARLRADGIR